MKEICQTKMNEFMEKEAYIKQLKALIKKYHPDLCTDEKLLDEYTEITKKLNHILDAIKRKSAINSGPLSKQPISSHNQKKDYIYYKSGIAFYKKIHPGIFYSHGSKGKMKQKSYEEQKEILNNIYIYFHLAIYYFRKVVDEFHDSQWLEDSKSKIRLLEKLQIRYSNFALFEDRKTLDYSDFIKSHGLKIM